MEERELIQYLDGRMPADLIRTRLNLEEHYANRSFGHGRTLFHIENVFWFHHWIAFFFKCIGLYERGRRNALDLQCIEQEWSLPGLPRPFEGFRILHLSDLHIDLDPGVLPALQRAVSDLSYDLCVLTGDFRASTYGPSEPALDKLAALAPVVKGLKLAVWGNHDMLHMTPRMEQLGYRVLLNETERIERGEESLYVCGVDDPHFYETDRLSAAVRDLPEDAIKILLSHSPEDYREASDAGFDLYLCGHTHAGQICLPGGVPLLINSKCPSRLTRHAWVYRGMQGYTSPGTGASSLLLRYNCPPAVVVHVLRKKSPSAPGSSAPLE